MIRKNEPYEDVRVARVQPYGPYYWQMGKGTIRTNGESEPSVSAQHGPVPSFLDECGPEFAELCRCLGNLFEDARIRDKTWSIRRFPIKPRAPQQDPGNLYSGRLDLELPLSSTQTLGDEDVWVHLPANHETWMAVSHHT